MNIKIISVEVFRCFISCYYNKNLNFQYTVKLLLFSILVTFLFIKINMQNSAQHFFFVADNDSYVTSIFYK